MNLKELEKLAKAATGGWNETAIRMVLNAAAQFTRPNECAKDAAFIAAANPSTVLALIAQLRIATEALERIEEDGCDYGHDDIAGEALRALKGVKP